MVNTISNATKTQPVSPPTGTSTQKQAPSKPQSSTGTDSVQLSHAAQAALAALQEARETPSQTAKEAGHGDLQAQRLLVKEAATKSVTK